MIDPFIVLTPILLLAVVALLRFVGCDQILGLTQTHPSPQTPLLRDLLPSSVTQGDPSFTTLTVTGDNFVSPPPNEFADARPSVVQWDGTDLSTAFFSSAKLAASITPDLIAAAGQHQITVFTPDVAGGLAPFTTSNAQTFYVDSNAVTVRFDPPPPLNPGDPLPAGYHNLDFTSVWAWYDPASTMAPANGVVINNNGPNPGSGDFSFTNGPRVLIRIRVYPKRPATVTISDGVNPPVSVTFQATDAGFVHFIDTGWTAPAPTVTVGTDIGFDLIVDTIIYQGPP
jgi:hypothetical protein